MEASKFIKFLRNGLFLVLVVSLVVILSSTGYAQQEASVIRQSGTPAYKIDPAVGSAFASGVALCNIYDSLVFPNPDGSLKPLLANSWEISEDGLTYTFDLVPRAKFRNGDELTADDVVFSMERIITIGEGWGYLFIDAVEGAKVLGKYKVQITLKKPFGSFLNTLVRLYILDKDQVMAHIQDGIYGEFGDYGKGWLLDHDAGSGPYQVKENKVPEYLLLEKFDDYWDGWENKEDAPQYYKLLGTREPITVKTLFSTGEIELSDSWQSSETYAELDKMPNVDLSSYFMGNIMNIMLNTKKPPTDDVHLRKALAYCFDYEQAVNKVYPGSRLVSGPVGLDIPGCNPNLKPYRQDYAKAEEELKQSPYYGKLEQYPVTINWLETVPDEEKISLMLQANAAKLGIKVELVKAPWVAIVSNMGNPETTHNGTIVYNTPSYPDAGSMLEIRYHSRSCGSFDQGEWLQNPEIDAMIDDAIATIDQKERFQKYYVIQEKIMELCPTIFIGEQSFNYAYRSDYVVFPTLEATKQGKPHTQFMGYDFYFRDFKVTPEKAQLPYTPFKP